MGHDAAFMNSGQLGFAGSRVYVHEDKHDEFVSRVAEKAKGRVLGNPLDPKTDLGPQISQRQVDKIMDYIDQGRSAGAKVVTGGNRLEMQGFYVQPTVFSGVTDSMAIAQEEIFGPVMCVLKFKETEEVL